MNKLAPLFIAVAFAFSGGALAKPPDGKDASLLPAPSAGASPPEAGARPPGDSQSTAPEPSGKPVEGFVVIQRNVYVPVDAEGKVASSDWVVVDRHGFVTAEELKAAQAQGGAGKESDGSGDKADGAKPEASPKAEAAAPSRPPHSSPARKDPFSASGPAILS